MPSVTLPNWTSHLTGFGPEEHGVTSNSCTVEKHELAPIDSDAEGYYPSIFKVLKEQVPHVKTAYYYNWAELINSMNKKYMDEVSFQYHDKYDSNYPKAYEFIVQNQKDPELVFLYSVHTDHAGHNYGWMSPQYIAAIESADSAIGGFLDKLKAAHLYKKNLFLTHNRSWRNWKRQWRYNHAGNASAMGYYRSLNKKIRISRFLQQ